MVDTRIAMSGRGHDTATGINQAAQMQTNNAIATQQMLAKHYEMMDDREKSRLTNTIVGATQLKTFIDADDLDGAHDFLLRRKQALQNRMANGENVDTQETDYAIEQLRRGNVDQLKNDIASMIAAGQVYGIVGGMGGDAPSSVREWQFYNSLPEDKKREWLINKRASQVVNTGGAQNILDPLNPAGKPAASMPVTLKPEDQPINAFNKAEATAAGNAAGDQNATAANTMNKMGGLMAAYKNIMESAKQAPSGGIASGAANAASYVGVGGKNAQNLGDFTVKRAALENEIRAAFRVAGSGAQSDADALPFINMLPNENDSVDVKIAKINSAMQALQTKVASLAQQRGIPNPFAAGGQGGGKVRVSNGQKTFEIDEKDLPSAERSGYKRQ